MSQPQGRIPGFPGVNHQVQKDIPPFALHANKKGNKFIAHLLGLDHEHPSAAAGSPEKGAAVKDLKLSDAFSGIKITPNFMFFLLFLGFFLWLFVIYWVRHHEPLANQVLGTPKAHPHKSALDRQLVAGIKGAFPVQTSSTTGEIYVPGAEHNAPASSAGAVPVMQQQPPAAGAYSSAYGTAAPLAPLSAAPVQQTYSSYGSSAAMNAPAAGLHGQPGSIQTTHGPYIVGIPSENGTRVKTIVSR